MNRPYPPEPASETKSLPVTRLIAIGLSTRLFVDTGVQIFFPFLSIIASGMGISAATLGRLISLRSLMGLFAPLFGNLAVQRGYRLTMRIGLLLTALGFFIMGLSNGIWMTALGMLIMGLGSFSFTPTMQAYLSNQLPYSQRAWGIGILEYSWALAGIVGLFLVGLLLEVASWRVPFFIIASVALLAAILYGWLPASERETAVSPSSTTQLPLTTRFASYFAFGENSRSAFANILSGSLLMFGAFNFFISYGVWMVDDFGLTAASLGQLAFALGIADLVGSILVSLISDRFGKRRSVMTGAILSSLGFALLPVLNARLLTVVIGFLIARSAFEFAIVANLSLLSEQVPEQRAKVMTLGTAVSIIGTGFAALTSPWLFAQYGIHGIAYIASAALVLSFLVLLTAVKEPASLCLLSENDS